MTDAPPSPLRDRVLRSWMLYDWANSAFATTILAAVFPVYYSTVAGATLRSPAQATQYYALTLSLSVLVVAVVSPILGSLADGTGTRKRWLVAFALLGAGSTLWLSGTGEGDWLLASLVFAVARIGFGGSLVFYDALLPHLAGPDQIDRVSAWGYALGYLGGGLLLAVDVALILALPEDEIGVKLAFVSVGIWWALFTIPLVRSVPEPPGRGIAGRGLGAAARDVVSELRSTVADLRRLPELARFLVAFLVYNDAIGVVIAVAAIYGAELGFGAIELTLAVLLVQFVGIPYSLVFGSMPTAEATRRRFLVGFVLANVVLLPLVTIGLRVGGPADLTGVAPQPFGTEGTVAVDGDTLAWTGRSLELRHDAGPGVAAVQLVLDGEVVLDDDEPLVLGGGDVERVDEFADVEVDEAGAHVLEFRPIGGDTGRLPVTEAEILPPPRSSNLGAILGVILAVQAAAAALAWALRGAVAPLADRLTTRGAILVALGAYLVVAVWGFALDSVVEFWGLAWLVAVCQGGSQALSRSLFSRLIPAARSGEFFGFFSVISKFASFLSPLVFALSVAVFDSSRPAVLSLAVFFVVGGWLLRGVDVEAGTARVGG